MKRHPALQDLSRDHYIALNRCLQVLRAVEGHEHAQPYAQAIYNFEALWTHDGLQEHFGEEEQDLVPLLKDGAPELAARMLAEHDRLRAGFHALEAKAATPGQAAETARLLQAHARWEEAAVFEWLQQHLGEAELQALWQRSRAYRQAKGLPIGPAG